MAKFYAKAPDGSDALLSIVLTGFTQSLQQNGWCKLPNGLLIQWSSILCTPKNSNSNLRIGTYRFSVKFSDVWVVTGTHYSGGDGTVLHAFTDINDNLNIGVQFNINSDSRAIVTSENWNVYVLYIGIKNKG